MKNEKETDLKMTEIMEIAFRWGSQNSYYESYKYVQRKTWIMMRKNRRYEKDLNGTFKD